MTGEVVIGSSFRVIDLDATLVSLVLTIGAPVLVALYYLEGLLVGKLLHPSVLFIMYVVITEPSVSVMVVVAAICVASATAGQWALYRGFNENIEQGPIARVLPYLDRVPALVERRIGDRRMMFVGRQFDRFGGPAICVSNATPGLRGLMTIVAGLSGYPPRQFVLLSAAGNAIYMTILLAVANGLLSLLGFAPEVSWLPLG